MRKNTFLLSLLLSIGVTANTFAANTTTTVTQVTNAVTISSNVDYVITSSTPFSTSGSVNIRSTEHAVVIIKNIKPSVVISNWLSHIYINGASAVDGENCQVKMYSHGAIILPYSSDFKPLTCYTQPNYGGTSCNTYSEGHDGGFMKTLSSSTLNNKIRSFKLKRGYMVTFALGTGGWGYSRCFIADKEDLEIPSMPANMDARVSSYRLFKWQNAKKAGLASDTRFAANDALNSSWCYSWGVGENRYPDTECVPNHIYENWPSAEACGSVDYSCHMKTNNEPGNSADDHPQDVATVLDNWQMLMRTGMRLCSESSHDGSMGHLKAFCDSIDARGWRCDLLDLHCYWASGTFNSLTWYSDNYGNGRPVWISEWVWGASWNNNGIFSAAPDGRNSFSTANQQACYDGTKPLLDILNSNSRIERYAYWNSEVDASKIYKDGTLSILGQYYANMNDDLGYNASNEFVPKVVTKAPTNLVASYNEANGTAELQWNDPNGDMIDSVVVEVKMPGKVAFKRFASVALQDMNAKAGATYTFSSALPEEGIYSFRVAVYPIGSTTPLRTKAERVITPNGDTYEDVTNTYVTNPGFDSNYLSSNLSTGASNHLAVNGWTTSNTSTLGCSAAVAYGSGYTINTGSVPATNKNGNANGGALGISQGWTTQAVYTQDVTLPAGDYRMSYDVYNSKNSLSITNNTGVIIDGVASYGSINNVPVGTWQSETIWFTLTESKTVTLSVGFTAAGTTSQANPFLFFDNITLAKDKGSDNATIVDYTSSITNNSYSSNNNNGWSGTSVTAVSYNCAEQYNKTFDYYQTITGLPAGKYRVGVQAFYRAGFASNDYSTLSNASNNRALLYATGNGTTYSVALVRASSEASSSKLGGSESTVGGKYIPNNMQAASIYFAAGKYQNYLEATVGSDGRLTIGIKKTSTISGDWVIFDNWTLEYYSVEEETDVDMTEYITNASYDSNNNNGWSGTSVTAVSYNCAEHYNKTFDYYQTIKGLPAGDYLVGVQAYYRAGTSSNDYSTLSNTSNNRAILYATGNGTTNSVALVRASSEASSTKLGGSESTVGGKYIPLNMQAASIYFAAGKYHNYLRATVGSDGTLTIGIKKTSTISADWTIFDNWTLIYNPSSDSYSRERINETTNIKAFSNVDSGITNIYTIEGTLHQTPKKGMNIIRLSNGEVRKVLIR